MKKALFIFLALVLLLVGIWQNNNNPRIIISRLLKKGIACDGELTYRLNLLGVIPAAEAVFSLDKETVYNGNKVYQLTARVSPLEIYRRFFNGYATLNSYVDRGRLRPIVFTQKVLAPGKEDPSKEVYYDFDKNTMTLGGVTRRIFPDTHDPLSALFTIKHMDLSAADEIEMNINTNKENYLLRGKVKRYDIAINRRVHKITVVNARIARRDKNDPYHRSELTMVLLSGKENIPVLIKVFASGALITAKLINTSP